MPRMRSRISAAPATRSRAWLYFASDLYVCFSRSTGLVSRGKLPLRRYLASLAEANVYATWAWWDPWPLLVAIARRLKRTVTRILRAGS